MRRHFYLFSLLLFLPFLSFAQAQSFEREVKGIENNPQTTWYSISLPTDVIAKSKPDMADLRVLRISATDTLELPYVLQNYPRKISTEKVDFSIINRSSANGSYFFTLENQAPEKEINFIDLDFDNENFDWRVELEGSQDNQEWFSILEDYRIVSYQNTFADYTFSKLYFPTSKYRYFRTKIKGAAVQPELEEAKVFLQNIETGRYLMHEVTSQNISIDKEKKQTLIDIELSEPAPVAYLNLEIKNDFDFYRPMTIEYLHDSIKTDKGYRFNYIPFQSTILSSFENLEFFMSSSPVSKHFRITIQNQDNQPLEIGNIVLKGLVNKILVRVPQNSNSSSKYLLTYGDQNAFKPNYDVKRFRNKIPENLKELTLGDEVISKSQVEKVEPLFQNSLWLWVLMIFIIILLSFFTFKMMRNQPQEENPNQMTR